MDGFGNFVRITLEGIWGWRGRRERVNPAKIGLA